MTSLSALILLALICIAAGVLGILMAEPRAMRERQATAAVAVLVALVAALLVVAL